jgi:hypothetical protein
MKSIRSGVSILLVLVVLFISLNGCSTNPPLRKNEVLLEDKGTAYNIKTPKWVETAIINGSKGIEKLPDYKDYVVVIAQFEAANLQSAQLLAERMQAQTEMASYLSTRVKDAFKGANVATADSANFGVYGERFVASVGQATYSGFRRDADWWVKVQTFKEDKQPDKQIYRVIQLWAMPKTMLQKQFDLILNPIRAEAKTPETARAVDLVENTVAKDFFGN